MKEFDTLGNHKVPGIVSAFVDDDAEILAHPPEKSILLLQDFKCSVEPFKAMPPTCPLKLRDGRRLTWPDFCFKRAFLLLMMIYDGKDGRERMTQKKAAKMWMDIQPTGTERNDDTLLDIWKDRDSGLERPGWTRRADPPPDELWRDDPYMTRADYLTMLVKSIREDEARHEARRVKAMRKVQGGGGK